MANYHERRGRERSHVGGMLGQRVTRPSDSVRSDRARAIALDPRLTPRTAPAPRAEAFLAFVLRPRERPGRVWTVAKHAPGQWARSLRYMFSAERKENSRRPQPGARQTRPTPKGTVSNTSLAGAFSESKREFRFTLKEDLPDPPASSGPPT